MNEQKLIYSEEKRGNPLFYRIIGIPFLKRIIMGSIGKLVLRVNRREDMPSYFISFPFRVSSLVLTRKWTYINEIMHVLVIVITAAIGYFFFKRGYTGGVIFMVLLILFNIGLIFLQHLNRNRINRIIKNLERRKMVQSEH